jgi:hypothetical protein
LRTHNLPSERLKMRLSWCRWSDVSKYRNAIRTHFRNFGHSKKRFGRSRGGVDLSRLMALKTNSLHSRRLKKILWWSRRSDVWICGKVMRTHFLLPGHRKQRLGEICLSYDLSRRITLTTHNLPSGRLKKRLCWCRWSDVSTRRWVIRTHFLPAEHGKSDSDYFS